MHLVEPSCSHLVGDQTQSAAGADRAKLPIITYAANLGAGSLSMVHQLSELRRGDHADLVHDQHVTGTQL